MEIKIPLNNIMICYKKTFVLLHVGPIRAVQLWNVASGCAIFQTVFVSASHAFFHFAQSILQVFLAARTWHANSNSGNYARLKYLESNPIIVIFFFIGMTHI